MENTIDKKSFSDQHYWIRLFTEILIVIYPFLNIAYVFAPYRILGKNIYIVLPVLLFGFFNWIIFWESNKKKIKNHFYDLVPLVGVAVFLWLLRNLLYGDDRSFLDFRFVFVIFLFNIVFTNLIEDPSNRDRLAKFVLLSAFVQALIGIIHTHFFSNINLAMDENSNYYLDYGFERTREAGMVISSNTYSACLVCGLFILAFYRYKNTFLKNGFFAPLIFLTILYAISLSGSRFPMAVGTTLGILFFYRLYWNNGTNILLLIVFSVLATTFFICSDIEVYSIFRFGPDADGRADKSMLAFQLFFSGFLNFFIGASNHSIENTITSDGLGISDNSYFLISLLFGVPFAIAWFWTFFKFCKNYLASRESKIIFFYILFTLGFYNSILWEIWLFNAMLTFLCIASNKNRFNPIAKHQIRKL